MLAVDGQLDRFATAMGADSVAQRARARAMLQAQSAAAESAVGATLQLSNLGALTSYLTGGDAGKLPIAEVRCCVLRSLCHVRWWLHQSCGVVVVWWWWW